jgi:fibro-slime domain-containing protein
MRLVVSLACLTCCVACAAEEGGSSGRGGAAGTASQAGTGETAGTSAGHIGFGNPDAQAPAPVDIDASGDPDMAADGGVVRVEDCGKIKAIIRDFSPTTHPDFEKEVAFDFNSLLMANQKGVVKPALEMGYPAFALAMGAGSFTGILEFYQWYVDTPGVNQRFEVEIPLTEDTPGHFVYDNSAFFPIDNMGFGNEGNPNNFHFTTEVRTKFTYQGGEVFTFRGDDDLWMFVDGKLAIDLGGLHGALMESVNMDTFASQHGLVKGETYNMDIFHAERHTVQSNFRIETTIKCFVPVESPPPPPPPPPPE